MKEDRPDTPETPFAETLWRLSRQLESRAAAGNEDPASAARARREALLAYERDRRRRLLVVGGLAVAAVVGIGVPLGLALVTPASEPPLHAATAHPADPMPPPAPEVQEALAPQPAMPPIVAHVPANATASAPPAPPPAPPLDRAEVREVQAKLRGFGFDPGPLDGDAGPRTLAAARRYRDSRNQPPGEEIDRTLLDQLRLDPAPVVVPPVQVAQRGGRGGAPSARGGSRSANPFDRLGRWLDSLVR